MPKTCQRRTTITNNIRPTNSFGKLGASNKCSRALMISEDEAFENWPYPFIQDMSKSIKHSPRSVWTCSINDADIDNIIATLIELLGCPNEGWAKNAYCGLLDLLEHGKEEQLTKAMKNGGIPAFRKLFSVKPHYSVTWDGFVAGLDIFERMLSCGSDLRRICVYGLGMVLRPIIQTYLAREYRIAFGVPQERLGNRSRCMPECRKPIGRGTSRKEQQSMTQNNVIMKKNFDGLTKHPFSPDLDTWLRRLETIVMLTSDPDSDEYAYVLSQIARWYPSYDGLKMNAGTCVVRRPVRRPETQPAEQKSNRKSIHVRKPKEPRTKTPIVSAWEVDEDVSGTIDCVLQGCITGPAEFHAGHYLIHGKLKSITPPEQPDLSEMGSKDRAESKRKQDQLPSEWYQQTAANLVDQVFSKVSTNIISEQEKLQQSTDSEARFPHIVVIDIHLSVPEHAAMVEQNQTDLFEELTSRHSDESKTRSVDTYQRNSIYTNRSQDRALIEELQTSHSVADKDISDEVIEYSYQISESVQGRQPKETEEDMASLSLIVNRSDDVDNQQFAMERIAEYGIPNTGSECLLPEDAGYQFKIMDNTTNLDQTEEENQQQKSTDKTEVAWKLYRKPRSSNDSECTDRKTNEPALAPDDRGWPNSRFQLVNTKGYLAEADQMLPDSTQSDKLIQPKPELLTGIHQLSDDPMKNLIHNEEGLKSTVLHSPDTLNIPPEAPDPLLDSQAIRLVEDPQYEDVELPQVPRNPSIDSITFNFVAPLPARTLESLDQTIRKGSEQHVAESSDLEHPPTGQPDQPDPSVSPTEGNQNVNMNGKTSRSSDKSEQIISSCIPENITNPNRPTLVESMFEEHPSISRATLEKIMTNDQLKFKDNDQSGIGPQCIDLPESPLQMKKSDAKVIGSFENPPVVEITSVSTSDKQNSDGPPLVRVYVNLKARASWCDSSISCPVKIETHVVTSPATKDEQRSSVHNQVENLPNNSTDEAPNDIEKNT